jgi:hypothetical protein
MNKNGSAVSLARKSCCFSQPHQCVGSYAVFIRGRGPLF